MDRYLELAKQGFETVKINAKYRQSAYKNLSEWLQKAEFADYVPQITHLIESRHWDYLLDSFYQVVPFGTGGRRGEVGIGPNRINHWTIQSSAQGHSQFLLKQYGNEAKSRGVVLAWDVRCFYGNKYFSADLPNPVINLTGDTLARAAAEVYTANGIKVYIFDGVRTTPELSFAVRFLHTVGGDVFSASHNPPAHNGKKVYDETGGQLVPPDDEELVKCVTEEVSEILTAPYEDMVKKGLIEVVGKKVDDAYVAAASQVSLSTARDIKIAFTPMHGCSSTSVLKVLTYLGFQVFVDPLTGNPSGKFEHVTFNIPNPEVLQSFDVPLKYAKEIDADILLNTDPDADRVGIMIKHHGKWVFINGNEIASILTEYVVSKRKPMLKGQGVVIKTMVTTDLIREICKVNNVRLIGDLLVGFKYVGVEMNKLEAAGQMNDFLFGCEESHGYIAGGYVREKDACPAAIWLSELAAELKAEGKTLIDYLESLYSRYGYFGNYLSEIRLPGAEGKAMIDKIQDTMRATPPSAFGPYTIDHLEDCLQRMPLVSETDKSSKNVLVFHLVPTEGTTSIKVTLRPSGTEPKTKMYIEVGSKPFERAHMAQVKTDVSKLIKEIEKAFMKACYKIIGVDFPDRGFLLFWQLPLQEKMKYFEIEQDIVALKDVELSARKAKLESILSFLGTDPLMKVDDAFKDKYKVSITEYLGLS